MLQRFILRVGWFVLRLALQLLLLFVALRVFDNPLTLFALLLTLGVLATYILASREAAIQLSLKRKGIVGEAEVVRVRKRGGKQGPTFWVTYEFVEFVTGRIYRREEIVSMTHYYQWQKGATVHTVVLPNNPRISRLIGDKVHIITYFGSGVICLIFPVYFLGLGSLPGIMALCAIAFSANLLWVNLRGK